MVVVVLAATVGVVFGGLALLASRRALDTLPWLLRPVTVGLVLHYGFWYGWVLPALSAPGTSDTGGALLGMFLLTVEPPACALVVVMVEAALWLRRRFRAR